MGIIECVGVLYFCRQGGQSRINEQTHGGRRTSFLCRMQDMSLRAELKIYAIFPMWIAERLQSDGDHSRLHFRGRFRDFAPCRRPEASLYSHGQLLPAAQVCRGSKPAAARTQQPLRRTAAAAGLRRASPPAASSAWRCTHHARLSRRPQADEQCSNGKRLVHPTTLLMVATAASSRCQHSQRRLSRAG